MLTSEQLRAGRAILNLTQTEFGKLCGLSAATIHRFENGDGELNGLSSNIRKIAEVLQDNGIAVVKGGACRVRKVRRQAPPLAEAS